MSQTMLLTYGIIVLYFIGFFIVGTKIKNNSIVDIGWGAGFVIAALAAAGFSEHMDSVSLLLMLMVGVWGGRLSLHIYRRNHGKPEDFRYAKMRSDWGSTVVWRAFLQVYMLQALIMMVVSSGFILAMDVSDKTVSGFTLLGFAVWLVGFFFESVGDHQLEVYKRNPKNKGKVIKTGLWRYTRHPNYFGEATMWWGISIMAFGATFLPQVFLSAIVITVLLLYVSGVPMLERKYQNNPDFQAYARVTNKFIPGPRKRLKP